VPCASSNNTMLGPAHCHIPLRVRTTDLYFGIDGYSAISLTLHDLAAWLRSPPTGICSSDCQLLVRVTKLLCSLRHIWRGLNNLGSMQSGLVSFFARLERSHTTKQKFLCFGGPLGSISRSLLAA
jgi:hypothetical protein